MNIDANLLKCYLLTLFFLRSVSQGQVAEVLCSWTCIYQIVALAAPQDPGQTDLAIHLTFVKQTLGEMFDPFGHPIRQCKTMLDDVRRC